MSVKGLIVHTDGVIEEFNYEGNYQKLCSIVDGYIQLVNFGNKPYFCYCNEEGKFIGLEENKIVTELWYNSGQVVLLGDFIVGSVIFFGHPDDEGNDTDYPDSLLMDLSKVSV